MNSKYSPKSTAKDLFKNVTNTLWGEGKSITKQMVKDGVLEMVREILSKAPEELPEIKTYWSKVENEVLKF